MTTPIGALTLPQPTRLQERWDPTFSEHSYGFRPGRSAHQAVAQAQRYIADGYNVVVDLDLEKFFDRVNHDSLMARVGTRPRGDDERAVAIRAFKAVAIWAKRLRPQHATLPILRMGVSSGPIPKQQE
jgi:retron-type reverse transcriptase